MRGPCAVPDFLKGPRKSFFHIVLLQLLLLLERGLTSPPCWWTSGVATLSLAIFSSTWFALYTQVLLVLLLKLVLKSRNSIVMMLVHHSILSRPRVKKLVLRLVPSQFEDGGPRPCHVVKMAVKSFRVSHRSSRMVWTYCWRNWPPSATAADE